MLSIVESFAMDTWYDINKTNLTNLEYEIVSNINETLRKIIINTKTPEIQLNINNVIKNISLDTMTTSKFFDITIRCENLDIKFHKIFLKYISLFAQIQDFIEINNNNQILTVNTNFNIVLCIKNYLYTGNLQINEYLNTNCLELLIQIDYYGILKNKDDILIEDNNLIILIGTYFETNCNIILNNTFKRYNFESFCDVIRQICDILENNKLYILHKITNWFKENIQIYDMLKFIESYIFEYKLSKTLFGQKLIIDSLNFDKFHLIVNKTNHLNLILIILWNEPPNMNVVINNITKKMGNLPVICSIDELHAELLKFNNWY